MQRPHTKAEGSSRLCCLTMCWRSSANLGKKVMAHEWWSRTLNRPGFLLRNGQLRRRLVSSSLGLGRARLMGRKPEPSPEPSLMSSPSSSPPRPPPPPPPAPPLPPTDCFFLFPPRCDPPVPPLPGVEELLVDPETVVLVCCKPGAARHIVWPSSRMNLCTTRRESAGDMDVSLTSTPYASCRA